MLDRMQAGQLPDVPHTVHRSPSGAIVYEHCITRRAFDGPYSILYHLHRPHALAVPAAPVLIGRVRSADARLMKRHFRAAGIEGVGDVIDARRILLWNEDIVISVSAPSLPHEAYFSNGDADALFFVVAGSGTLRSAFGALPFSRGDYISIPRGVMHRFTYTEGTRFFVLELESLAIPDAFRNALGQLRMDAPYGHRDFVRPSFEGPVDEGIRSVVVQHAGALQTYTLSASPFDAIGWDGAVYPWAFPISRFRPRVGQVHLPPNVHTTFVSRGVVVSSFVPRPLDFHASAVPCPYPHSSVDCDEVIFYVDGDFLSRRGIEASSVTLHPAGIPHGPAPGAYEASIGRASVNELAVMLDTMRPLFASRDAEAVEDADYHARYYEAPT